MLKQGNLFLLSVSNFINSIFCLFLLLQKLTDVPVLNQMQNKSLTAYHNLDKFKLFIFDLDGTLYDQGKLRQKLIKNLILRFITFRISTTDLKIINTFRRQREQHKGYASKTLEADQYHWCAEELKLPVEKVKNQIKEFMHILPLRYLLACRYPYVDQVFAALKEQGTAIAVYSDYPVHSKINALELKADAEFCSTDKDIQQFKPSGNAIDFICRKMNIAKDETILIGDREDTDGESAKQAEVSFLKVDIRQAREGQFYINLLQLIKINHG